MKAPGAWEKQSGKLGNDGLFSKTSDTGYGNSQYVTKYSKNRTPEVAASSVQLLLTKRMNWSAPTLLLYHFILSNTTKERKE